MAKPRRAVNASVVDHEPFVHWRTVGAQIIGRIIGVFVSNRHARPQNAILGQVQKIPNGLGIDRPAFLWAAIESGFTQEQHDRIQQRPRIGPLRRLHLSIERNKQGDGRAEKLKIVKNHRPRPALSSRGMPMEL